MILFLVFEPLGLVGIWRRVQTYFLLWPFKQRPVAGAAPMSEPLLAVDKLEVVYQRAITAVQGVSLAVAPGQIVALLGTNGAGKTTTLARDLGLPRHRRRARHRRHASASRASASRTGRRTRSRGAASCWCPSATRCSRT